MMKKIIVVGMVAMLAALLFGCDSAKESNGTVCRIHGIANSRFNGVKIFLVPFNGPATMETVDSVVIKDGKFEFESDCGEMKVVRMDYRHRMRVEDLLLVMEPGDVEVAIDSVSSGKGTWQNDSLQRWKENTQKYLQNMVLCRKRMREAEEHGDQRVAEAMKFRTDSLERTYKRYSRRLADSLKEGVLYDFLDGRFPLSYRKKMPDGTITTVKVEY